LPPADTSAALASPAATAAPTTRLPPTVPGAEAARPAAGSHAGATPTPTPSAPAAISGKAPATAQPRTVDRDAEPVLLQARALSPAERCEGRALAALWSCIDRHCKAEPGLRDHPDCVKARREAEQRATPSR
jgi:hypothetical protein